MVNLWVWEKFLAPISVTLSQGHQATKAGQNLTCPLDKVRTACPIATKLGSYIPLVMLSTWINFGGILSETFFSHKFFVKFQARFSTVEHSICHILGMVMWNKKEMSQLDAMLTRVPLTLTLDLEFSRSNCISGMGGSIVMEQKGRESIGCPDVKQ